MNRKRFVARAEGFTLVEVAVATAIIGVGMSALLVSVGAGTKVNDSAQKLTQAVFLAGEIREWASNQTFGTVTNTSYSPPHNGCGTVMNDLTGWSQTLTVTYRNASNLSSVVTSSDVMNIEVRVSYGGSPILTTNFLLTRRS